MPSAPNLNKIKDSISNGLESISNKSETFIEISKLKYKIHFEENSMEDLYRDIGKDLYKIYKGNTNQVDRSLLDYCSALSKIEKRMKSLVKELDKVSKK